MKIIETNRLILRSIFHRHTSTGTIERADAM